MRWILFLISFLLWLLGLQQPLQAASRIKDIAVFEGVRDNELTGLGLVIGLNGTGDRSQTVFTTQALANMLERSGLTVDPTKMRVKNVAAVEVTATLPHGMRQGSRIDITVSSFGDASSIQGGVLLQTELKGPDGQIYAIAQGQIALGGFSAGSGGNRVQSNHPTVGRIPNGAIVEQKVDFDFTGKSKWNLVLYQNDFTSVSHAVHAVNDLFGSEVAHALDGRTIEINVPANYSSRVLEFIAQVENTLIEVDQPARVVINEKTGTIVFGKDVQIAEVSIVHGSLSLQVGTILNISQPEPLSQGGKTTIVPETTISVQEEKGRTVMLHKGASIEEVVKALNAMGAGPRDIIAILQAIKAQGALQADLEII
jgi:flagellar P-ring protein FlgI